MPFCLQGVLRLLAISHPQMIHRASFFTASSLASIQVQVGIHIGKHLRHISLALVCSLIATTFTAGLRADVSAWPAL